MILFRSLAHTFILWIIFVSATPNLGNTPSTPSSEVKILDLKYKKEITDKKLSLSKKYLLTLLVARELQESDFPTKAAEYYKIAKDIKIDENKNEINESLSPLSSNKVPQLFFII